MKVKDLIAQLELIEDKEAEVFIEDSEVSFIVCDKTCINEAGEKEQYIWLYV